MHCAHLLTPFCFLFCLMSFLEESKDADVNTNQDKMLIPGQPCTVVWRNIKNLSPVLRILSRKHLQTAPESHDLNMVLVVWKWLLADLTTASNSCVHRYRCKKRCFSLQKSIFYCNSAAVFIAVYNNRCRGKKLTSVYWRRLLAKTSN